MESVTLTVNPQQLQVIIEALANAPFRMSAPILNLIEQQVQAQRAKPAPAVKDVPKE